MNKLKLLLSAAIVAALALPVFVFAAAPGAPPTGSVAPTFNGLFINTGLELASDSIIFDGPGPLYFNLSEGAVIDSDNGLQIQGVVSGGINLTGDDVGLNIAAKNPDGRAGIVVSDFSGVGGITINSSGDGGLKINSATGGIDLNTTGGIINSGGGEVRINDDMVVSGHLSASGNIFTTGGSSSISSSTLNAGTLNASNANIDGSLNANSYEGLSLSKVTLTSNSNPSNTTKSCVYDGSWKNPISGITYYYFYCISPV